MNNSYQAFPFIPPADDRAPITRRGLRKPASRLDSWVVSVSNGGSPRVVDLGGPAAADSWTDLSAPRFPDFGETFLGFRLVAELGRGAFGRVYLARQDDLARRLVALKISTEIHNESQNLAQLQHTNIVPVYSVHRFGALHAVCMPYLGSATLADVLQDLQRRQTPPASGKGLVSTIQDRVSRTRASLDRESSRAGAGQPPSLPAGSAEAVAPGPRAADGLAPLRVLEGLTHVEAVLWLGEHLAGALAHAHERGILHGDLKPANILLTDDGQPMLLDFNLSTDVKADVARAEVGGTLPYMAPEHLASFARLPAPFPAGTEAPAVADGRSDLYSLGVVLYELLTGRAPFSPCPGNVREQLPEMIRDRLRPPPRLRRWNRAVTPAVESIVRHCLEPDPARRYQNARQLAEDLERHRRHQPLAHAGEKSLVERAEKWVRRNRRRALVTAGLTAAAAIACLTAGVLYHRDRVAGLQAEATLTAFREDCDETQLLLAARSEDADLRQKGLHLAHQALARYNVLDRADWRNQPAVQRLAAEDQQRLAREVGELLLLTARADDPGRREALTLRAGDCFPPDQAPRALYVSRAEVAGLRGADEARALQDEARRRPAVDATDHYLLARERVEAGRGAEAIEHLRKALQLDPKHFAALFYWGNYLLDGTNQSPTPEIEAIRCYTACVTLRPNFYGCWYNRGLARLRLKNFAEAESDFTAALGLRPDFAPAYLHRGLAREGLAREGLAGDVPKQFREALADLDRAVEGGATLTRAYLARARVRRQLGDVAGADRDHEEGLRREPADEESYVHRGVTRLETDPEAALADFRAAARLNPRSLAGLYNQAVVLVEKFGRLEDAVSALDQLLRHYPRMAAARVVRGVFRARLGQREGAHQDGQEALRVAGTTANICYQAACLYAQTSKTHADDRDEAFRLLGQALRLGFGHDRLESDPDLQPLRDDPRFRKMVQSLEGLRWASLPALTQPVSSGTGGVGPQALVGRGR